MERKVQVLPTSGAHEMLCYGEFRDSGFHAQGALVHAWGAYSTVLSSCAGKLEISSPSASTIFFSSSYSSTSGLGTISGTTS
ncbi:hypothetical protein A2U01_0029674, partial [Trifolium medium]|nr:hypothetical protein [Trifolium medium]